MTESLLKGAGPVGSVKELRRDLKRKEGGFLKRIPPGGMSVRFTTEPNKWWKYLEHYVANNEEASGPCIGIENGCKGCEISSERPKLRWLANAVDLSEGKLVPLVLVQTVVEKLSRLYEKFDGTIMDRNFDLIREGEGKEGTRYDVEYDMPSRFDYSKHTNLDLGKTLIARVAGIDVDDDEDDEDEEPAITPPVKKAAGVKKATGTKVTTSKPVATKTTAKKATSLPPLPPAKKAVRRRV